MARAKDHGNGQSRLDEALAALVQAQATMVQTQATFVAQSAETNKRIAEYEQLAAERFARIESILIEHNRILKALPEAIREKIGFKPPATSVPQE